MFYEQFELALLALAVVVDTVLLLVIFERVNRTSTAIWLQIIVVSTWLTHFLAFGHALIRHSESDAFVWLDHANKFGLAFALALMPCAMLHAAIRLNHTQYEMRPPRDWRYILCYLPLVIALAALPELMRCRSRNFAECFAPHLTLFFWSVFTLNSVAVGLFWRFRESIEFASTRRFLRRLVILILGINGLLAVLVWLARETQAEPWVQLLVVLSPLSIVLLFLYHSMRDRLIPLVVERGLVYGAWLTLGLLIHRILIIPWVESMQRKSNLDIVLVESIILLSLVVAWSPLRERVTEALRYLFSRNIFKVREAVRSLSLGLSQQGTGTIADLCDWFRDACKHKLEVQEVSLSLGEMATDVQSPDWLIAPWMDRIVAATAKGHFNSIECDAIQDEALADFLRRIGIQYVFCGQFKDLRALVFLGPRIRNDRFSQEQRASLSILVDQFAATVYNRFVEQERRRAERLASQQEKLAVLGLISGSIAHEVKNPLSSIRTITRLMREELQGQPQVRDLDIILQEIDRLMQTTNRLLDYSKPADDRVVGVYLETVVGRLFHILQPWAQQQRVDLIRNLAPESGKIPCTDSVLSEVLFNLLRNAIEATSGVGQGRVEIRSEYSDGQVLVEVVDNGPGIEPSIRDTIYKPFVTSKEFGTGLGLYIAAERVRSMRGAIECETGDQGTCFRLKLPITRC